MEEEAQRIIYMHVFQYRSYFLIPHDDVHPNDDFESFMTIMSSDAAEDDFDIDVYDGFSWIECIHSVPTLGLGEVRDVFCNYPVKGSKVKVSVPGLSKRLVLCEVEVYTLTDAGKLRRCNFLM